jgi:hypothetical protein
MNSLPADIARCTPNARHCPQVNGCARANDWPHWQRGQRLTVVDASLCLKAGACPMFIDVRYLALKEAA